MHTYQSSFSTTTSTRSKASIVGIDCSPIYVVIGLQGEGASQLCSNSVHIQDHMPLPRRALAFVGRMFE